MEVVVLADHFLHIPPTKVQHSTVQHSAAGQRPSQNCLSAAVSCGRSCCCPCRCRCRCSCSCLAAALVRCSQLPVCLSVPTAPYVQDMPAGKVAMSPALISTPSPPAAGQQPGSMWRGPIISIIHSCIHCAACATSFVIAVRHACLAQSLACLPACRTCTHVCLFNDSY